MWSFRFGVPILCACIAFFLFVYFGDDREKNIPVETRAPALSAGAAASAVSTSTPVETAAPEPPQVTTPPAQSAPSKKKEALHTAQVPQYQFSSTFSCEAFARLTPYWIDADSSAARTIRTLRAAGDARADRLMPLACVPHALWVDASPTRMNLLKLALEEVKSSRKVLTVVLYNHPTHASSLWDSGVAPGAAYKAWATEVAQAIGETPTLVIIEPDAIPLVPNLSAADAGVRMGDLHAAVEAFALHAPGARTYLDAGHSAWRSVEQIAGLLNDAGVQKIHGFALDISNYRTTDESIDYAQRISNLTGGSRVVIDTGRNGVGPKNGEWCNALGRRVGTLPHPIANHTVVDALLWIKPPGESDGTCNGGPEAGKFWIEYAIDLLQI